MGSVLSLKWSYKWLSILCNPLVQYQWLYWAHLCSCTVGSYAPLCICLSVRLWLDKNYWTLIHISKSFAARVKRPLMYCYIGTVHYQHEALNMMSIESRWAHIRVAQNKVFREKLINNSCGEVNFSQKKKLILSHPSSHQRQVAFLR